MGVLLLHDPRRQGDAEVHDARAVRVAVQLPVPTGDVIRESLVRCGTGGGGEGRGQTWGRCGKGGQRDVRKLAFRGALSITEVWEEYLA